MGYLSAYETKVLDAKDMTKNRLDELKQVVEYAKFHDKIMIRDTSMYKEEFLERIKRVWPFIKTLNLEEIISCMNRYDIKWYEWKNDITQLSRVFPEYIFQVRRDGEESGDIEMVWFHDGKTQGGPAKVVFPDFDPNGFKIPTQK